MIWVSRLWLVSISSKLKERTKCGMLFRGVQSVVLQPMHLYIQNSSVTLRGLHEWTQGRDASII